MKAICFALLLTQLLALDAAAGDWKHAVQACNDAGRKVEQEKASSPRPEHSYLLVDFSRLNDWAVKKLDRRFAWEDCVIKFAGLDWLAPTVANIAPGSSFAPGLRVQHQANHGEIESLWIARAYYSLKNFYFMEGRYDRHFPVLRNTDERATISIFARRMDLKRQDFYGLGPSTALNSLAEYRHQEDDVGVTTYFPLNSWFAAGGGLQVRVPAIKGISDPSTRSVQNFFPASQLPGFTAQPTFLNPQAFLRFHTPFNTDQTWHNTDVRLTYDHFHDVNSGTSTFDRLQAFAIESFEIRRNIPRHSLPRRKWWQNVLCQGIVGDQCRLGNIVLDGLVTTSFTGNRNSVPFYYQETLGGSDINGLDTIRGLVDYRLRAPNRLLLQADFYHDIWGPFGILGFVDTGRVALTPSDLSFSDLRHDFGAGAYIRAGGNIVLRAYIAFGAGEGSHPNAKLLNAF
jgi:hypothetical protein